MKLSEVVKFVNGETAGNTDIEITRLAKIEDAESGDITFVSNPKYASHLASTSASAVLISKSASFKELSSLSENIRLIKVDDPYLSFLKLVEVFYPAPASIQKGVHSSAHVAKSAEINNEAAIGAKVVIGERCKVGRNASLHPGVVLYDDVQIGDDCLLYANVTVREQCKIGARAIIHSGTVIGSDGFGFAPKQDGSYDKIPQRGTVVIEDDVEIGANCAIDRATIGETRIKRGVKLDNLVHIAHNVVIGENTVIAGQTGISGSTKIGVNCVVAGQVGFTGHIQVADRTTVGAQSGVSKSIPKSGTTVFGYPAKEHLQALRMEGALRQLPELLVEIRELKKKLEEREADSKEQTSA